MIDHVRSCYVIETWRSKGSSRGMDAWRAACDSTLQDSVQCADNPAQLVHRPLISHIRRLASSVDRNSALTPLPVVPFDNFI